MSEVARRRDWLAELRGATKDLDSFKNLVTVVAKEAPGLREEVCRLASELPGGIGEWTDDAFFTEEVLREAHKAEAYFFGPESQPRVEDSKPTEPKTIEELKPVEEPTTPKMYRRRLGGTAPKPMQPEPPPVEEEPKKAAVTKSKIVRVYGWDEVIIPKTAGEIEALTYVPGLVGQIVDWIVSGARRPNRVMALGVALGVVGTLIGRGVEGPTGNATHLYIFILAPTGWGKDHPLWCGNKLMFAVGAGSLLGPSEFVSGRGIIKYLKRNPLTLCIVDELGDVFQLINSQQANPWVTDLMGHFKKLYNSWDIIITAETMRDQSTTINHPAVSIVGACTPQALFEALKPGDVESGFANRPMLLPFEGFKRPPERDVPEGAEEPPAKLVAELRQLMPAKMSSIQAILSTKADEVGELAPPVAPKDREKIRWGSEEAKARYFEFSREIDQWQEKDKRRFELGMRAAENAVRCSTIVAAGCFSPTVDVRDIEWALKWSRVSFEAADGGFKKYMRDYYEFPKFCDQIVEAIRSQGGFMSDRDLGRAFRRNMKHGHELEKALHQLEREDHISRASRKASRGPVAMGWMIVEETRPNRSDEDGVK
jgi:hypothetical protein